MHGGDIYRNKVRIDFSINVNPLGVSQSVKKALMDAVLACKYYPDIKYEKLKQAISFMTGADEGSILCGNGASELFMAIIHGVNPEKIVIPVPSFLGYEKASKASHADIIYYEMKKENGFCLDYDILDILSSEIDVLFLANPNNPTGSLIRQELLEAILQHCMRKNIILVLDECFIEFTKNWKKHSFLQRINEFPNLIIVRAFTKIFAIPGVRLGYMMCSNCVLLKKIQEQLSEWNVSVFAQRAGIAAAKESAYLLKSVEQIETEREYLIQELQKIDILVYASTANFLLLYSKYPLQEELLKYGILIRDCSNYKGLSKGYYRIAVKQRRENKELIVRIKEIIDFKLCT